ncbi:enoyl-CoA hydratase/isomerase family protein [Zopfochytrium polystomum]|nr:enoyl-CoA hydratase/isomerase family protein [Zopfochytrium polystomum]
MAPHTYSGKTYETLTVDVRNNGVAILTLTRPDAQNSFNSTMCMELAEVFFAFDADDAVKVVVVTGHGKYFCAGADLREGDFSTAKSDIPPHVRAKQSRDGGGYVTLAIQQCRKVVIAAINGPAVGIGITMTLAMDIRLAWKDAKVGFVFARRGIVAEAGSNFYLPRLVGHSRALELVLSARVAPASHRSLDLLFSELVDNAADVLPKALALADEIAVNNSLVSCAMLKSLFWRGGSSPEEGHLLDSEAMFWMGNGKDAREGVISFIEKRRPDFPGRVTKDMPPMWPWWRPLAANPKPYKL